MELDVIIEKLDGDAVVPLDNITGTDNFQVRHDGILLNGKLHFWEQILTVQITNRELLDRLRKSKGAEYEK